MMIYANSSSSSPRSLRFIKVLSNRLLPVLTPANVVLVRSSHRHPTSNWRHHHMSQDETWSVTLHSHRHLYERASTFSSWPDIVLSLLSADSISSKWTRAHLCSWPSVLSRHSVDRSLRAFHSSTHNVVRASCFEVLSASHKKDTLHPQTVCLR